MAGADTLGSAGTLVVAGLATAGQYLQSQLLDVINSGAGVHFAVFFFIVSAIGGITLLAFSGRHSLGVWLLIAPALFSFATQRRVDSAGVRWELGERVHEQGFVAATLKGIYEDAVRKNGDQPPVMHVSWLFAKWDSIVTSTLQSAITILGVTDLSSDLEFISRTQRFQALFNLGIPDSDLATFVHTTVIDKCVDYLALCRALYDKNQFIKREDLEARLGELQDQAVLSSVDPGYELLAWLNDRGYFGERPRELQDTYTCPELWNMSMAALSLVAESEAVRLANAGKEDELEFSAAFYELAEKFGEDEVPNPEDVAQMINAMSVRMLYTAVHERYAGLARRNITDFSRRPDSAVAPTGKDEYDVADDIRNMASQRESSGAGQLLGYMLSLPYLQGMLLFFLSLSYPCFAFMLLIPGRAKMFLVWMGLWLWVKSWDLGFAVVMLIDELLYYLLPHGPAMTDADLSNPGRAFEMLLSADPTYSISVYYNIVAMMLAAIPVISGLIVGVGATQVASTAAEGFDSFAAKMGSIFTQTRNTLTAKKREDESPATQARQSAAATSQISSFPSPLSSPAGQTQPAMYNGVPAPTESLTQPLPNAATQQPQFATQSLPRPTSTQPRLETPINAGGPSDPALRELLTPSDQRALPA